MHAPSIGVGIVLKYFTQKALDGSASYHFIDFHFSLRMRSGQRPVKSCSHSQCDRYIMATSTCYSDESVVTDSSDRDVNVILL